jgi:hypothetical protein
MDYPKKPANNISPQFGENRLVIHREADTSAKLEQSSAGINRSGPKQGNASEYHGSVRNQEKSDLIKNCVKRDLFKDSFTIDHRVRKFTSPVVNLEAFAPEPWRISFEDQHLEKMSNEFRLLAAVSQYNFRLHLEEVTQEALRRQELTPIETRWRRFCRVMTTPISQLINGSDEEAEQNAEDRR